MTRNNRLRIAPSILAADISRLGEEVRAVDRAGADDIHIDIMDGHFVPNLGFSADTVAALRSVTTRTFDVHMLVMPVAPHIEVFAEAGADVITIHVEIDEDLAALLRRIRDLGKKAGIALNPSTPPGAIDPFLDAVDRITVMGVEPGFGGQTLIPAQIDKLREIKRALEGRDIQVEIDGGVRVDNAAAARQAGADILVAGTAIFGTEDYAATIRRLREG